MLTKNYSKTILLSLSVLCMLTISQLTSCENLSRETQISGISSLQMATNMKIGFNLGNTLDATYGTGSKTNSGLSTEIAWLPDYDGDGSKTDNYTTQANIQGIKNAGFDTIRIPISWHNHITDSNYTIDSAWMARVKQIVDWAYEANLYIIINIHHDNLSTSDMSTTYGYCIDSNYKTESKAFLVRVWEQIAATFNDNYDEHLIFELLNEPRCIGNTDEWYLSSSTTPTATEANSIITEYEKACIAVIRASGGNNAERFLMVPGYAGSNGVLSTYTLPTDTASDKLILSYHAYSPYNFAMYSGTEDLTFDKADKDSLIGMFSTVKALFPNIGIVIGEASASNKNNLSERISWISFYFDKAYNTYNMPTIIWDNGEYEANETDGERHGYYDRSNNTWYFPSMIKAALTAVGKNAVSYTITKSGNSPE